MKEEDKDGRMSWDQTAVLAGVKGIDPYFSLEYGTIEVDEDGSNRWIKKGRKHARLIFKTSPQVIQGIINDLMMHQPVITAGK